MIEAVEARQSCLGTFRRGAVTFGEVRQSRHGMTWFVRAGFGESRCVKAVKAVQVVVR